jgi:hypothetical protein
MEKLVENRDIRREVPLTADTYYRYHTGASSSYLDKLYC